MIRDLATIAILLAAFPGAPARAQSWDVQPTPEQFSEEYPHDALAQGVEGRAVIRCVVNDLGGLAPCEVISEEPVGYGFGAAAPRLSRHFRMALTSPDGSRTAGGAVGLTLRFGIED